MSSEHQEPDLKEAISQLGLNLRQLGQQAWESPQRRRFQAELEGTMKELEGSLQQAGQEFRQSEAGQRLKQGLEDIKDEFDRSELEEKARSELVALLAQLNSRLETWLENQGQSMAGESEDNQG
jgi:hypothetical protein